MSMNERPRRSTRAPARTAQTVVPQAEASATPSKRKRRGDLPNLSYLLTASKSALTSLDISTIVNRENFAKLSPEAQHELCSLLPATAFKDYQRQIPVGHPANMARASTNSQDSTAQNSSISQDSISHLDRAFFDNPFLLSAAHTFQDHLVSGWMTATANNERSSYQAGVLSGTMHAQWKDEEWQQSHKASKKHKTADLDLANLVQRKSLREGDIIVYKRRFTSLATVVVEKELLVQSVNDHSGALNLLLSPKTDRPLPPYLRSIGPPEPQPPVRALEGILSSLELEEGVLDEDGRIPPDARNLITLQASDIASMQVDYTGVRMPSSRASIAAKSLTVWRWDEERLPDLEVQPHLDRGGREYIGTVFYLSRA